MNVPDTVKEIETTGASFRLKGGRVHIWYPDDVCRKALAPQIAFLRNHRSEVASFLGERHAALAMPPSVRLIEWKLKEPPIAIETCAIVIDPVLFVRSTLLQLEHALTTPKRWIGWSVPQLIDRLAQVGVTVALETPAHRYREDRGLSKNRKFATTEEEAHGE